MDITGKKGEQAVRQVSQLGQELQALQENIQAIHQNIGQYEENFSQLFDRLDRLENSHDETQGVNQRMSDLEEISAKVSKLNRRNSERLRDLEKDKGEFRTRIDERFEDMGNEVGDLRKRISGLEQKVQGLRTKLNDLKEDAELEFDSQEKHLQRKVEKQSFENRSKSVDKELNKLRTSVNVLADELDRTDDITIE